MADIRLKIYDVQDNVLFDIPVTKECEKVDELMKQDYVNVSFVSKRNVRLAQGAYVRYDGERYTLTDPYSPDQTDEKRYRYTMQFHSRIMLWDRQPFFFYTIDNGSTKRETDWSLTARPVDFLAQVIKAISYETNERWSARINASLSEKYVDLDFQDISILGGLNKIASAFSTEWFADKRTNTIHFGKASFDADIQGYYDDITLEVGKNIGAADVSNAREKYYTRFFAFGSSRNITQDYNGAATNSSVTKHLTLDPTKYPQGYKDIRGHFENGQFVSELHPNEIFPAAITFDEVYPRSYLTISDVRRRLKYREDADGNKIVIGNDSNGDPIYETYAIWYFQIADFAMSDDLIIAGLTLSAHFSSGALMEREFELSWHKEASEIDSAEGTFQIKQGDFEIIFTELSDGQIIPAKEYIVPKDGDKTILFNIKMPAEYVRSAQQEVETELDKVIERMKLDLNNYTFDSYPVEFKQNNWYLRVGQKVTYKSGEYSYTTRIMAVTRNLAQPMKQHISVGEEEIRGTESQLIEEVRMIGDSLADLSVTVGSSNGMSGAQIRKMFLRKDVPDTAEGHIIFKDGLSTGDYDKDPISGLSATGGAIDKEGNAEFEDLQVRNDATMHGQMGSPLFRSGFPDGYGWRLRQREDGLTELEIDTVIARKTLRVFEMVISQLLGENDNRIFTAMIEVDHYDASSGRIYLDTKEGKMYNPLRADDWISVQQYDPAMTDGWVVKSYDLTVAEVGTDWIKFRDFDSLNEQTAEQAIKKGDTLVRLDNFSNADRKGIIEIMTVGADTPYLDIVYGLKTDPITALKGRIGNLAGLGSTQFGYLHGFGEYLINLYAIGDFYMRNTGESLASNIQATRNALISSYSETTFNITDEDNFIQNGFFALDKQNWKDCAIDNNVFPELTDAAGGEKSVVSVGTGEEALLINGRLLATRSFDYSEIEDFDGIKVLHARNLAIAQSLSVVRQNETHKEWDDQTKLEKDVYNTVYFSVRFLAKTAGTLSVWLIDGNTSENLHTYSISANTDWQTRSFEIANKNWSQNGKFVIAFTGDLLYRFVTLTENPLNNYRETFSTKITQTAHEIRTEAEATKQDLDGKIRQNTSLISQTAEEIRSEVTTKINGVTVAISQVDQKADGISSTVAGLATDLGTAQQDLADLNTNLNKAKKDFNDGQAALQTNIDTLEVGSVNRSQIEAIKASVEQMMKGADAMYNELYGSKYLTDTTTKTTLKNAHDTLSSKSVELLNAVNTAAQDDYITDAERTSIQSLYATYKTYLKSFYDACDSAYSKVTASISSELATLNSALDAAKKDFNDGQAALQTNIDTLEVGSVNRSQIEAIKASVEQTIKAALMMYNELYNNVFIGDDDKATLNTQYNYLYSKANNDLLPAINTAVADDYITDAERTNIVSVYDTFKTFLKNFYDACEAAYSSIESGLNGYLEQIQSTARTLAENAAKAEVYTQASNPWSAWTSGTEWQHYGAVLNFTGSSNTIKYYTYQNGSNGTIEQVEKYFVAGRKYRYIGGSTANDQNKNFWEDITDVLGQASWISQKKDHISSVVANFDADGNVLSSSGIITTSWGNNLFASLGNLKSYIKQTAAEITLSAENINFIGKTCINGNFVVDSSGNVTMKNTTITGNLKVEGSSFKIHTYTTSNKAVIDGLNSSNESIFAISVGYDNYNNYGSKVFLDGLNGNSYISKYAMFLQHPAHNSNSDRSMIRINVGSDFAEVTCQSHDATYGYQFIQTIAYPRLGYSTIETNSLPTSRDMCKNHQVYCDGEYLKIKRVNTDGDMNSRKLWT
jgi:uncharacterized protein (UPF0262 family)